MTDRRLVAPGCSGSLRVLTGAHRVGYGYPDGDLVVLWACSEGRCHPCGGGIVCGHLKAIIGPDVLRMIGGDAPGCTYSSKSSL